jgi:L-lactate dehydrogenase
VAVQNVHAYIVGEHGDSEVRCGVRQRSAACRCRSGRTLTFSLDTTARADISRRVVGGGDEVIAGKGFTNYAISLATTRIIESVLYDEHQVLPVSSLIDDFIGIKDVCLSVPSVVNRNGVQRSLPVPLSACEAEALQHSAEAVPNCHSAMRPVRVPSAPGSPCTRRSCCSLYPGPRPLFGRRRTPTRPRQRPRRD